LQDVRAHEVRLRVVFGCGGRDGHEDADTVSVGFQDKHEHKADLQHKMAGVNTINHNIPPSAHPALAPSSESTDISKSNTNSPSSFQGWTTKQIWDTQISLTEKERLRGCEMVDEEEEWNLLAGHYGVLRGWRG